jgi:hypothetical protein
MRPASIAVAGMRILWCEPNYRVTMRKIVLLVLICFSGFLSAQRDESEIDNWVFGIHGGFNQYRGELGNGWYVTNQAAYSYAGFSLSRFLHRNLDVTFYGSKGELGHQTAPVQGQSARERFGFRLSKTTAHLWLRYYPIGHEAIIQPFVFAGGSMIWQLPLGDNFYFNQKRQRFGVPEAGAGVNLRITRWMRFQAQEIFTYTSADYVDYIEGGMNDLYLMHSVGLIFNFPKFTRRNSMSQPDREVDKCPPLPRELQAKQQARKAARSKARFDRKERRARR